MTTWLPTSIKFFLPLLRRRTGWNNTRGHCLKPCPTCCASDTEGNIFRYNMCTSFFADFPRTAASFDRSLAKPPCDERKVFRLFYPTKEGCITVVSPNPGPQERPRPTGQESLDSRPDGVAWDVRRCRRPWVRDYSRELYNAKESGIYID